MGSGPDEACEHLVRFGNLLLDRPVHIREGNTHPSKNVLQARQARSLARERHELNQTIGNIVSCSVHVAFVDGLLNKLTDNELVLFYAHRSFPPSNRVLVGAA